MTMCRALPAKPCAGDGCAEQPCAMFAERASVLPAVERSVDAPPTAPPADRDAGAVALARRYAELLDQTEVSAQYRKPIERIESALHEHALQLPDIEAERVLTAWSKVRSALAEHTTASDLGPKLLAVLTSLHLTPASREKATAPARPGSAPAPEQMSNPLHLVRDAAAGRYGRTAG